MRASGLEPRLLAQLRAEAARRGRDVDTVADEVIREQLPREGHPQAAA